MKNLMKIFRPFNVFSLVVILGVFVFAFRLANVLTFTDRPAADIGAVTPAGAQQMQPANGEEPPPMTKADIRNTPAPGSSGADTAQPTGLADNETPPVISGGVAAPADAPADDAPQAFSNSELEVLQSLSKRRDELDAREKTIARREALLAAAEQEVDHKIAELNKLKGEIEDLLGKQQTMENDRIESLVKIYENMKPKEAATIFNTLDMNVLLTVISHMNERKSAPIIAAMDPQKARIVTIRLADQHKLPAAPDTGSAPPQGTMP
jgi:flagellar motility protein MotE (MotC chaperone)